MLNELFQQVQDRVQDQIREKFGLSEDQTQQSASILLDNFRRFFKEDLMAGGMSGLRELMQNGINDIDNNPTLQNLRNNLAADLEQKVGLSTDIAGKVRDLSLREVFDTFSKEFMDENGKPDMSKLLSKLSMEDIQTQAKEMLNKVGVDLGKLFGKK